MERIGRYLSLLIALALTMACLPSQIGGASPTAPPDQPALPSPTAPPTEASPPHPPVASGQPPILISIVMHNEEPRTGLYPDFVHDEEAFWEHRSGLVRFVDMLHANGMAFNYQSDWNFLKAVGLYDAGTPETDGKNVVRYIADLGFEVDPHAHETEYNYADVAYLIRSLGVGPSHTVGGFIALPPEDSKLEYFWQPIVSTLDPTYTWQAEILWGGATLHHTADEPLWVSGVWKPRDNGHFLEHDEAAPLPYIGNYGSRCEQLVRMQQEGRLEGDRIYTCTLFVSQNFVLKSDFLADFEQRLQALDAMGNVRWVGLSEVIEIWRTEYGSRPNLFPYQGSGE